jgi:hypothetical protein
LSEMYQCPRFPALSARRLIFAIFPPNVFPFVEFSPGGSEACSRNSAEASEEWDEQGDRIGRTFAFWAVAYFGHFYENDRSALAAWRSGHRIRLRNEKTRLGIPPGYKVFMET